MPEVRTVDLHKRYGEIVALDGVSIGVGDGEYVCIIGPSGSGKSTLIKIIAGVLRPDRGEVYIDGVLVNDVPVEERGIGLVMQDILLFPHMTVWDNVVYGPLVKGMGRRVADAVGAEVASGVGLTLRKRAFPSELSRGTQQKVAIARAVAAGARLLLLDEPLGSIDPRAAKAMRIELRKLVKDLGLTAIHVTHNQEEAMSIADKIIVMRRGRVEQVGTPLELYARPRTPFVAKFVGGETNFLEGRVVEGEGCLRVQVEDSVLRLGEQPRVFSRGERVVVAVRPEHVQIAKSGNAPSENVMRGRVKEVSFLGPYYRYLVDVGETEVIAKTPRRGSTPERGEVRLVIKKAHVFEYPEEGLEEAVRI